MFGKFTHVLEKQGSNISLPCDSSEKDNSLKKTRKQNWSHTYTHTHTHTHTHTNSLRQRQPHPSRPRAGQRGLQCSHITSPGAATSREWYCCDGSLVNSVCHPGKRLAGTFIRASEESSTQLSCHGQRQRWSLKGWALSHWALSPLLSLSLSLSGSPHTWEFFCLFLVCAYWSVKPTLKCSLCVSLTEGNFMMDHSDRRKSPQ